MYNVNSNPPPFALVFSFISIALSCFFISLARHFFTVTTYFAMIGLTFIGKQAFWSIAMLLMAIKFYIKTALKFAKNTRQMVSDFSTL